MSEQELISMIVKLWDNRPIRVVVEILDNFGDINRE